MRLRMVVSSRMLTSSSVARMYQGISLVHAENTVPEGAMPVMMYSSIMRIPAMALSISSKQNMAMPIRVIAKKVRIWLVKASLVGISRMMIGSAKVTIQLIRLLRLAFAIIDSSSTRNVHRADKAAFAVGSRSSHSIQNRSNGGKREISISNNNNKKIKSNKKLCKIAKTNF